MKRLLLPLLLFVSLPLWAVDYPVVYIRAPRNASAAPQIPEVTFPANVDAGADLVRLDPNGAQTVLYDCSAKCSVTDPSVSLDGTQVYFALIHDPSNRYLGRQPVEGCSIYSMPVAGGAATPLVLASSGYTAGLPASVKAPTLPCHLAPQELPAGRMVFTSTLWGQEPVKGALTFPALQLFVRHGSGEIEPIAPMTLGVALHPILLTTGEVMFATAENQGHRDDRLWGLWTIYPDGRNWAPLVSAFQDQSAFHFQAQMSSGAVVVADYYNANNFGFGTLLKVPWPRPVPAFHSASERPCLTMSWPSAGSCLGMAFSPRGASVLTPWTHPVDVPASCYPGGATCAPEQRVGKVTHPAAYPGDRLLVTWSGGPVHKNTASPPNQPYPDTGVYLTPPGGASGHPSEMELVVNDAAYSEHLARVVASYAAIYGKQPAQLPWLPQSPLLPTRHALRHRGHGVGVSARVVSRYAGRSELRRARRLQHHRQHRARELGDAGRGHVAVPEQRHRSRAHRLAGAQSAGERYSIPALRS